LAHGERRWRANNGQQREAVKRVKAPNRHPDTRCADERTATSNYAQPTSASECKTAGQTHGTTAPPQKPADRDQQLRAAYRRVRVQNRRPDARCDSTAPRASGQRPAAARSRQARQSAKPPSSRTVQKHRPESQRTETSSCAQPTGASECQATVQTRGATAPPQEPADRDQQLRAADRRVRVQSHRPAARCDSTAPRASGQRPAAVRSRQARQSAKPPSSRTVQKHTQKPADRDRQIRTADRRVRAQNRRPDARYDSTAPKASGQRPAAVRSLQARQSAKPPSSRTIRQHRPESQRTATALRTMRPGWPKRWFG
jgi:hypothetical protein